MLFKKATFQEINHKYLIVQLNDRIRNVLKNYNGIDLADSFLAYGYEDIKEGITLEVMCCLLNFDGAIKMFEDNEYEIVRFKINYVKDLEFEYFDTDDSRLLLYHNHLLELKEVDKNYHKHEKIVNYY